jgi:hypothetical protein
MKKITIQANSSGPMSLTITMDADEGVDLQPQGTSSLGSSHQGLTVPDNSRSYDDSAAVASEDDVEDDDIFTDDAALLDKILDEGEQTTISWDKTAAALNSRSRP